MGVTQEDVAADAFKVEPGTHAPIQPENPEQTRIVEEYDRRQDALLLPPVSITLSESHG